MKIIYPNEEIIISEYHRLKSKTNLTLKQIITKIHIIYKYQKNDIKKIITEYEKKFIIIESNLNLEI